MRPTPDVPHIDTTLFHSRVGGFPLFFCTYTLLDADSNPTDDLSQVVIIRVTALNGERFRLRHPADICRFLAAVGCQYDEEAGR